MRRALVLALTGILLGAAAQPEAASAAPAASARPAEMPDPVLVARLDGTGGVAVDGRTFRHSETVRLFYAQRGFVPAWTDAKGIRPAGAVLASVLQAASADGLDPADYHPRSIKGRMEARTAEQRAELDLLMTDALMAYAVDLRAGRIAPRSLDEEHTITPPNVDPLAVAKGALMAPDLSAYLSSFAPPHLEYAEMRKALAVYRDIAAQGGWPAAGPGPVLKPGFQDASVPALRRRLAATGEFTGADLESDIYDAEIEEAVKRFQERNGLVPDGVVGNRTRAALNTTAERRVEQIIANMERLRWMPDRLGERHIVVNLAGFTLKAVEKGEVRLEMPVIVGSTVRQTPILASRIGHLVVNPTWTVPETIAKEDILPKVLKDPGFLIKEGIQVYEGWGEDAVSVNPYDVDWRRVGKGITRYRLRQAPGPTNPLGQIKFMFANDFDIYLHDTPQREKFSRTVRTLSSGCVRVGDPEALADFLFTGMSEWTRERRQQVKDTGQTKTIFLRRSVPVYLTYQTVVIGADGDIQFRPDFYERDQLLLSALAKRRTGALKLAVVKSG